MYVFVYVCACHNFIAFVISIDLFSYTSIALQKQKTTCAQF